MKFALVNNIRTEATKGVQGICPNCGSQLIAKCGSIKVDHWAHKKISNCDHWWENETEWHRKWKDKFPKEWQEISLPDEKTGERHIADVRTSHGLTIEFQHSFINPEERISRENFYKNMVWVVDGTRLTRDYPRFLKGKENFRKTNLKNHFLIDFPNECFPSAWIESSVPVIFDFLGMKWIDDKSNPRNILYCLLPMQKAGRVAALIPRSFFINAIIKGILFKKQEKLSNQNRKPINSKKIQTRKRESQYIFERGRWKKRKRF